MNTLLPRLCPGCGEELPGSIWICLRCRRSFRRAPDGWICFLCRSRDRAGGSREAGAGCVVDDHDLWWGKTAFWMEAPLDGVVHAFKYAGRRDLARPLGRLMSLGTDLPFRTALLTSVPLHPTRERERGYNQAAGLGESVADIWGAPYVDGVVRRTRFTPPQARLEEALRDSNVQGAFSPGKRTWIQGRTWVLIDDVATTGATLMAVSRTLYAAGAARVVPVTLALA